MRTDIEALEALINSHGYTSYLSDEEKEHDPEVRAARRALAALAVQHDERVLSLARDIFIHAVDGINIDHYETAAQRAFMAAQAFYRVQGEQS